MHCPKVVLFDEWKRKTTVIYSKIKLFSCHEVIYFHFVDLKKKCLLCVANKKKSTVFFSVIQRFRCGWQLFFWSSLSQMQFVDGDLDFLKQNFILSVRNDRMRGIYLFTYSRGMT